MSKNTEKEKEIVQEEEIQKAILDQLDEKAEAPNSETSDKVANEEKTLLDIAEETAIKLAPAVPGAPNNMIQKHVDNFLVKIAGETPVDENVRNSTEYWLDKIAQRIAGIAPITQQLWYHPIAFYKRDNQDNAPAVSIGMVALLDSGTPYISASAFFNDMFNKGVRYLCPATGLIYDAVRQKQLVVSWIDMKKPAGASLVLAFRGHYTDSTTTYLEEVDVAVTDTFDSLYAIGDSGVNRII